jgi:hypothetical protein
MKNISDFIGDVTKRVSSRKFQVLLIACFMFWNKPEFFTGYHLTFVLCMYIGGNVFEKFVLREKA